MAARVAATLMGLGRVTWRQALRAQVMLNEHYSELGVRDVAMVLLFSPFSLFFLSFFFPSTSLYRCLPLFFSFSRSLCVQTHVMAVSLCLSGGACLSRVRLV